MASLKFDGSDIKIEAFSKDLLESIPNIEAAIMGGEIEVSGFNPTVKGLASKDIKWADAAKNIKVLKEALYMQVSADTSGMGGDPGHKHRASGGPIQANQPYMVGEGGPEMIVPNSSGKVINTERTQQIQEAGLQRSVASTAGSPTIVNAPTNTVVDNKQSNTTNTTVSFSHPSSILNAVNVAA
jgi:hypothetical protein